MNRNVTVPRIMTAAWSTVLPSDIVRIGISRGPPRGHPAGYRMYRVLAPGSWFRSLTPEAYVKRYEEEILGRLDARDVVRDLVRISGGRPVALLCFERPETDDGWCHRSLVASWMKREMGVEVLEYGFEMRGGGDQHPMLPAR